MTTPFTELNKAYTKWVDPDSEQQWEDHYQRTYELMTTKCDRNLPLDCTPEYKFAAAAIRPKGEDKKAAKQAAWDAYDERMMNYMKPHADKVNELGVRSLRHNSGKADYSLIPMAALAEVAKVLEYGASKYERGNWLKPTSWEVSFACMHRHMSAWQSGEDNDEESGHSHIAHAACNLIQMLHMLENYPEELER
jgi:hypothetical protein